MTKTFSRRRFLASSASTGAAMLAAPSITRSADRKITVGTFGGFFEESFREYIYPAFTKATGIMVNSIAVPTGETYVVQIRNAARGKKAPSDVAMMGNIPRLRGQKQNLFKRLDAAKIPNLKYVPEHFQFRYDDGAFYASAAISWYITLCSNTNEVKEAPKSWGDMWGEGKENTLGLLGLPTNSFLLEVTATTFFDGTEILRTREGIEKVFVKLAEIQPNVRLWYKDEGTFQQQLVDGEIPWGQYFHDVAQLKASEGAPLRSTFPKEGGILDSGAWVVPEYAEPVEEVQEYINYMLAPDVQAELARNVGTAPVVDPALTGLTPEELAAVSSDKTPIIPAYDIYFEHGAWITDRWNEMISG